MKRLSIALLLLFIIYGCKKKDIIVTIPDSNFQVTQILKNSLTDYSIAYLAKPGLNEDFLQLNFQWSTSADFSKNRDSIFVSPTKSTANTFQLKDLKDSTTYYCRLGTVYRGSTIYSQSKEWTTDNFKILNLNFVDPPWEMSKGDTLRGVKTNFPPMTPNRPIDTKVFVGTYECKIVSDYGDNVYFDLPGNIVSGKYLVEVRKNNGMVAYSPDSILIKKGKWTLQTPPVIPVDPYASESGLYSFGTCQSPEKGYIIGGILLNGLFTGGGMNSMLLEPILEYEPSTTQWKKLMPINPRYIDQPVSYYYNNSIYILGGVEWTRDQYTNSRGYLVKKMLRFDLGSLTWSEMDSMPTYGNLKMTSFELNNEWYIGMGDDSARLSQCCGYPLPNNKFWKYNPSTNQWTQLADYPGSSGAFPTCFTIGSKAYAFYGAIQIGIPRVSTDFRSQLWEYDPASNQWSQISIPVIDGPPPGEKYQIVSYNGKAYFLTGQKFTLGAAYYFYNMINACLEWDPVKNTYTRVAARQIGDIMKLVYSKGDQFIFQTDEKDYSEKPNRTLSFKIND